MVIIFIVFWFLNNKKEYNNLESIEQLLIKHSLSYTAKPIEPENQLKFAREQGIYQIENNNVYIYIVEKSDMEEANFQVSNELLDNNYAVSTTDTVLFAHTDLIRFQKELYAVIDEIKKSEQ